MEGSTETGLAALRAFANAIRAKEFDDYLLFQPTFAQVELDAQGHATAAQVRDYQPGVLKPRDR
jgi:hypothetical protein